MLSALILTIVVGVPTVTRPIVKFWGPLSFNYVDTQNSTNPSISANGEYIAYRVTDPMTGYSSIHVYDTVYSTDTTVSGDVPNVGRPRISRDGTAVAFYGATAEDGSSSVLVYIASSTSASDLTSIADGSDIEWAAAGTPPAAWQPPGISNESGSSTYSVSYPDLHEYAVNPDGTYVNYVCVNTGCAPGTAGTVTRPYEVDNEPTWYLATDIDASGDGVAYNWNGGSETAPDQIYVNATCHTAASIDGCYHPSIDAAGDKLVFDSTDTSLVGSTPPTSPNVYTLVLSTDAIAIPYGTMGSPTGECVYPFISSNGDYIAFTCTSLDLVWGITPAPYSYGTDVPVGSPSAVIVAFTGSSFLFPLIYSVEDEGNRTEVVLGADTCVDDDGAVAFDSLNTSAAEIISGVYGYSYIYYVQ